LRELYQFQEELVALQTVFTAQLDLLFDFSTVLDTNTYRVTTRSRIAMNKTEKEMFSSWTSDKHKELVQLSKLMQHVTELQKTARHGIEIVDEDQGRIILVFTVVTVIFLPLSFVTGFYGMNTNDIRNMESTQWIYWATALPLTVIVIGLSVLAFGKMSEIQDGFSRLWSHVKWRPGFGRKQMRLPFARTGRDIDEEVSGEKTGRRRSQSQDTIY
jgi:Mg2+ and Co2+ transporter CorA